MTKSEKIEQASVLIVGTGVSGLFAALQFGEDVDVVLLSKKEKHEASTYYAQGGIASVFSSDDTYESHIEDTHKAGVFLCRKDVVDFCVQEGPQRIRDLIDLGVAFTKNAQKEYSLGKEGGHSHRRVLHAEDMTGKEIERALLDACRTAPNIRIFEHHMAIDLILSADKKTCCGAFVFDQKGGEISSLMAKVVLLASGGAGKTYLYTSNPDICTGDGIAMAYRAGARIANMEFMQFHPTCLFHPKAKTFLISEALRGEGGILRRMDGEAFMEDYHPDKELAPRDIVARAIDAEMKRTGDEHVYLDMTHLDGDFLRKRFPNIYEQCKKYQIDLCVQPIPVVPAAHYTCGGILIDAHGRTDLKNLYALGEVSCSGLHGANRLASNSLLEGVVFAHRVAEDIEANIRDLPYPKEESFWDAGDAVDSDELIVVAHNWDELRRLMWNYVGIVRSTKRLQRAQRRLALLEEEVNEYYWNFTISGDLIELRNLLIVSRLIVESAMHRKESRGLHYNVDFPDREESWQRETVIQRDMKKAEGPGIKVSSLSIFEARF